MRTEKYTMVVDVINKLSPWQYCFISHSDSRVTIFDLILSLIESPCVIIVHKQTPTGLTQLILHQSINRCLETVAVLLKAKNPALLLTITRSAHSSRGRPEEIQFEGRAAFYSKSLRVLVD